MTRVDASVPGAWRDTVLSYELRAWRTLMAAFDERQQLVQQVA
jgi:hypothetical protein